MGKQEISHREEIEKNSESDAEIILNQLFREYATDLKKVAYLYINDHSECEDIIQEVYISCFQNLSKFRSESNYKTWLTRITINKCKDHQRLWRIKNIIYRPINNLIKKEISAEDQYFYRQHSKVILEQVSLLPIKFKEVLILYYFQEMTMQEVSEILEINHNTVKSRLLRGKNALLKNLERRNINGSL